MDRNHETTTHSDFAVAMQPADFVRLIRTHVRWWAIPAVACAALAAAYSLVAPRHWQATQTLFVRPQAASVSDERLGKFSDLSEMKTLQETILELAKSQSVIHATLTEVGPRTNSPVAHWPTERDIQNFREEIDMRPPGGAEFGKTEVFYLSVRDTNRNRASALVAALCTQLQHRMQELRDHNAQGMVTELQNTVAMAEGDLAVQIGRLSAFEAKVGADLAELRSLNADTGGQDAVSQELQSIDTERRATESQLRENQRLLKLLVAAKNDPQQLLATPNSLLISQPAISQLKNALVNAQIRTASLLGTRSEEHPFVIAARESEQLIRDQLNRELDVAIRGLHVDIDLATDREKSLTTKYDAARQRVSHLAANRAEYANLLASVQNHTRLVEAARKNLADARAQQAGARSASLISRVDGVEAGISPIGPSRSTITGAGGLAGLLLGFGVVFLFANPAENSHAEVHPSAIAAIDVAEPVVSPNRKSNESFGMFRGMTLQEAIHAVQHRG
ncbi:MAG TPA: Wzz/FepE/Etk N-terminal domain-containing protein [Lacipirellulaceae bacterium]|nr:Wzz/FepE/Etk N-terminal domain-containing protein [Lacipirellulaceae bacterium]